MYQYYHYCVVTKINESIMVMGTGHIIEPNNFFNKNTVFYSMADWLQMLAYNIVGCL